MIRRVSFSMTLSTTLCIAVASLGAYACSGDDSAGGGTDAGTAHDTSVTDTGGQHDTSTGTDTGTDTGSATDTGTDTGSSDAGCPAAWTVAPVVDTTIAVPADGGGVLLHASATGTQNYTCLASTPDGGATVYTWTAAGPEATLKDCNATSIGTHFASEAGAGAPEWKTNDGTFVIGKRVNGFTPDGGGAAVPWLLLQSTSTGGGAGALSRANFIQRVQTTGGKAPAVGCDVNAVGTTTKVAYTADYYFFGQ